MLKYISKVFLKFKLPGSTTREGFYRQSQPLREIISSFGVSGSAKLGKVKLDQSKNVGQLGLKNDDVINIK